jgi:hypothetical protein
MAAHNDNINIDNNDNNDNNSNNSNNNDGGTPVKWDKRLSIEDVDSPKRKAQQFWQTQEQDAIRSRSSSLSKNQSMPNLLGNKGRSPSFSSKARFVDVQPQIAELIENGISGSPKISKDHESRFNKLVSLTGRKDSLASIQPYLNPKTQEGIRF